MGRQTMFAHRFSRQLTQGLDFQVAPGATRLSSLNEPAQLGLQYFRRTCRLLLGGGKWRERSRRGAYAHSASGESWHAPNRFAASPSVSSIVGVSRSPARTNATISAAVEAAATAQMRLIPSPNKRFLYGSSRHDIENTASSMPVVKSVKRSEPIC